jgi:hypothetical protein
VVTNRFQRPRERPGAPENAKLGRCLLEQPGTGVPFVWPRPATSEDKRQILSEVIHLGSPQRSLPASLPVHHLVSLSLNFVQRGAAFEVALFFFSSLKAYRYGISEKQIFKDVVLARERNFHCDHARCRGVVVYADQRHAR